MAECVVYTDSKSKSQLAKLGLVEDHLMQAVYVGLSAWAECTPDHPVTYPGTRAWGEAIASLAGLLKPLGWQRADRANQPLIINKRGSIAITISTGNEDTGKPGGDPTTKAKKGPKTAEAIARNCGWLFPEMEQDANERRMKPNMATWILLVYRDEPQGQVRCELSLPISLDEDNRIDGWSERIILSSGPLGAPRVMAPEGGGEPPKTPEIKIEIKRRA